MTLGQTSGLGIRNNWGRVYLTKGTGAAELGIRDDESFYALFHDPVFGYIEKAG